MQALILAAGRGSRLGEGSSNLHKCLLEVGRRPIIEHQLEILADAGVGPVGMVLGYCADEIREVVGIRAEYIFNPRWKVTNSLYSFSLARDWITGPAVVLNCDILFHPAILDRLLAAGTDAIAFDSGSGDGREHMKVRVIDGVLDSMSKQMPAEDVSGENVGILSLTGDTMQALFLKAEELAADKGQKLWLGSAVCEIAREREIRAVDIAGLPWGEIDFPYDLDRVRKETWPAIRRSMSRRIGPWSQARRVAVGLGVLLVLLTVLAFRSSVTSTAMAWETVDIDAGTRVRIQAGDRTQSWQLIGGKKVAETQVDGPTMVRIDSRIVLGPDIAEVAPYVLEVEMDGTRLGWFSESVRASETWRHPEWTVGKRERITIDVPEGVHRLRVRLVAADTDKCLLRIRQEVPEELAE